jgi:hypothetical protein
MATKPNDSGSSTTQANTPALELVKKSPEDWARAAYPMQRKGGTDSHPRMVSHPNFWQHKAAAALHGWADHAHHAGAPIQLTAEQYFGALVAVTEPAPDGNYLAHLPALSPHGHVAKQLAAFAAQHR